MQARHDLQAHSNYTAYSIHGNTLVPVAGLNGDWGLGTRNKWIEAELMASWGA
jgi:hypothetical protein